MKDMIARAAFKYGTRHLKPGDRFSCENKHADTLELMGKAKTARPVMAAAPAQSRAATPAQKPKRTYVRRDMRAQA